MLWIKCLIAASNFYTVPAEVVMDVVRVESRYCTMSQNIPNRNGSKDHGCMQINDVAIRHYKLSVAHINDHCYNIWSGVAILADLRQRFPKTWLCRYNVGAGPLVGNRGELCKKYLGRLRR